MKSVAKPSKLLKFYHLPGVNPSDIGFVKFEVECLHKPEFSRKGLDYQHRDIRDWLYAHIDLNVKEPTGFEIRDEWIYVNNGVRKKYRIRQEPLKEVDETFNNTYGDFPLYRDEVELIE